MEITRFEVAGDLMVTLHMGGMPQDAKSSNTTVYIAGDPQGKPAIYFTDQRVVFKAKADAVKGKISVMIGDLTAESAEDFTPPAENVPEDQLPVVESISQSTAAPGERRNLRGRNLGKVTAVALFLGNGYVVCTGIAAGEQFVAFTVPPDTLESETQRPVFIRTSSNYALTRTPVSLKIVGR